MSKPKLAYYMFDAARTSVSGGGSDIFCTSLQRFFEAQHDRVDLTLVPVVPSAFVSRNRWERLARYGVKLINDYASWYNTPADLHVMVYPKLPVTAFSDRALLLHATRLIWKAWARSVKQRSQQVVVIVEDLPAEQGFSLDMPQAAWGATPANRLERTVFQSADTLVVPSRRMAAYIQQKHTVPTSRMKLFRRNIYMTPESPISMHPIRQGAGINVLYSGGLDQRMGGPFRRVLQVFKRYPQAHLWICGHGQERVQTWIEAELVKNACHVGVLNYSEHDRLARQCDFGLLLYPPSFYNDMTPTMKYTGYAANGLAILSTDLATVKDNIQEDGIGKALPLSGLLNELGDWLSAPAVFQSFKHQAESLAPTFRQGVTMREWFDALLESRSMHSQ